MLRVGRFTYWLVFLIPLVGLLGLIGLTGLVFGTVGSTQNTIGGALAVPLVAWIFVGRYVASWLTPLFVSRLSCPQCHEDVDPVGVWRCGCGYHDHRERHVLGFHCPACKGIIGHIHCPRCEASILLW